MNIDTTRLKLRPLGREHIFSTHAYAANPENCQFMVYLPNDTLEETMTFLELVEKEWQKPLPDFYEFAIFCGDIHIGAIGVQLDRTRAEAELGWILHMKYWGQGYAEEAARAVLAWLRDNFAFKRLIAHCDAGNLPSARLMEKLGLSLVSRSGGRKNKASEEEREELLYQLDLI